MLEVDLSFELLEIANLRVNNVFISLTLLKDLRKIKRSRTRRFHFSVKLFLLGDIFTQNIFLTFFVNVTSKELL